MRPNKVYIGTITGWVLIVILEIIASLCGAQQFRRTKMPLRFMITIFKYIRRTTLFSLAIANLILLSNKYVKNN